MSWGSCEDSKENRGVEGTKRGVLVFVLCVWSASHSQPAGSEPQQVQTNGNFILASKKWDSSTREFLVHSCVFHIAAEAPWPRNFVLLQGQ